MFILISNYYSKIYWGNEEKKRPVCQRKFIKVPSSNWFSLLKECNVWDIVKIHVHLSTPCQLTHGAPMLLSVNLLVLAVGAGVAQLVSAWPSELEVPSLILGDFSVCFDFLLIRVALAVNTHKTEYWHTEGGGGGKVRTEGHKFISYLLSRVTLVKESGFTFTFIGCCSIHFTPCLSSCSVPLF